MNESKLSEQGDRARKALHDMRWGPHIEGVVERQEVMDDAIKIALGGVATLEAKLAEYENDETPTRRELALVKRKLEAMKQALVEISELEDELCSYCEGSGGRYADGGAHYPSENAPVVPCGQCGGSGIAPPPDARDLAASALATPNVEVPF